MGSQRNRRTGKRPSPARPPHILIVDDKSCGGWTLAAVLRRAGFRVGVAEDTWAGWHAFMDDRYNLLITSEHSAGLTGLDLIRKVRTVAGQLPCMLIWERSAPDGLDVMRLLQPGTALERPVPIPRFLAVVRHHLRAGLAV